MKHIALALTLCLGAIPASYAKTDAEAAAYCESVGGTPTVREFALANAQGIIRTGMKQTWCNLHIGITDDDKTDNHAHIEVKTLANEKITLAGYALAHADEDYQAPAGSNPAFEYCLHVGGIEPTKIRRIYPYAGWLKEGDSEGYYGNCIFADGSSINQWTLRYSAGKKPEFRAFRKALLEKFAHQF